MASVWKRLQRVNKRAAKFQYTASYHRIDLDTTPKWKPNKLSIVWTRRSRRVVTDPLEWEPSLKDPLKGSVIFTLPENKTVAVTLFKDSRTNELEDKEWTFVLEDVSPTGRRRRLAQAAVNLRAHASLSPARRTLLLTLEPCSGKVARAAVSLTLHCVLLREGRATDEDMQSLASLLSVNNNSDVAVLEDLDEDDYTLSDHSTRQMSDFRQQMEEMTQSLSSEIAATPNSVQSLNFDTPTAPQPPESLKINLNDPKYNPAPKLPSPIDNLKTVVFKPKTVMKRNLKPLDLKCNLNDFGLDRNDNEDVDKTPTGGDSGFNADKEKTPVVDLLEWCQSVTSEYKSCPVTDLTTSFKSGLAFCAIIHRFRPDLIDFSGLQPDDCAGNVRCALAASAALGIPPVLAHTDVSQPDRLAVMTYLFQLRAHFTGNELQVEQLGNDETESSYLVGRHDTDAALPPELFSREVALRRSQRAGRTSVEPTPTSGVNVRQLLLSHSNNILNKCRAVTENKHHNVEPLPARPEILMTRKELTDPFASDEEDEVRTPTNDVQDTYETEKQEPQKPTTEPLISDPLNVNSLQIEEKTEPKPEVIQTIIENQSPLDILHINNDNLNASDVTKNDFFPSLDDFLKTKEEKVQSPELPKPTPQLLSRHDELKERARQLLEATKKEAREKDRRQKEKEDGKIENVNGVREPTSPKKVMTEEERQTMLRERARKLIADARAGIVSPSSPLSPGRRAGAVEIISKQTVMDEIGPAGGVDQLDLLLSRADSTHSSPSRKTTPSPDRSDPDSADCKSVRSLPERVGELSISAMVERLTPDKEGFEPDEESGSYIQSELEALEKEQTAVDERAAMLEKQLRRVMQARDAQEEDKLMSQWFNLVNKKNALLRRQMQLNILEQEEDLSRRCALLARELRLSLAVEEWRKTPGQRRRERLLLQDLIAAVNERDRLVQEMDEQEKAIADDDEIQRNLSQVEIQRKNNCILQ